MASLQDIARHGQSIWLDFIDRNLVTNGGLQRLVDSGVTGVTTNPTIFHKAITAGDDYDEAIRDLLEQNHAIDPEELCEALMVGDVQMAADVLRSVYDQTQGRDGYVSLEVPPDVAFSVERTLGAASRLRAAVDRPNVMIKVPGTAEGVKAFERLTADGFNVNVTLLFGVTRYEEVVRAWARGLSRNKNPERIASVASFFVSRVDKKTDALLEKIGTPEAEHLRGRVAIANAKWAYHRFQALLKEPEIAQQLKRGARPQRPLWASTSTKDPKYRDVMYVEALIGPDTVNTLPPETLDAVLYHGEATDALEKDIDVVQRDLESLKSVGVSLDAITAELESEGVVSFRDSWSKLLDTLKQKRFQVAKDYAGQ